MNTRRIPGTIPVSVLLEPAQPFDTGQLKNAVAKLTREFPSACCVVEGDPPVVRIGGNSETELIALLDALVERTGVTFTAGAPMLEYRETIRHVVDVDEIKDEEQPGGAIPSGIRLTLSPLRGRLDIAFEWSALDHTVTAAQIKIIEQTAREVFDRGRVHGFPLVGIRVRVNGIDCTDDADIAVLVRRALRRAIASANPGLLEPVARVFIETVDSCIDDVIADLGTRRGKVEALERRNGLALTTALVPYANLFGYDNSLRAITNDHGSHALEFAHYDFVPEPGPPGPAPTSPAIAKRVA